MDWRRALGYFVLIFAATALMHAGLLRLPYFWDEAGYYIPAARDFFLHRQLIPTSTHTNAHPPLPSIVLAEAWWIFGYSPLTTRLLMVVVSALALLAEFAIGRRLQNDVVAWCTVACTALYPVWFAQSSLAHADVFATCFALWGIYFYFAGRLRWAALIFSLAVLSKESAVLFPVALWIWSVLVRMVSRLRQFARTCDGEREIWLLTPVVPLVAWFTYHWWRTGFVFGNPEFQRYNLAESRVPARVAMAFLHRGWHLFGHMNMFVLIVLTLIAMSWTGLRGRERIAASAQAAIAWLVLASWIAFSFIGGALLTRYLLPCYPLVTLIFVSTLWRRWRWWPVAIAVVLVAFALALVRGPRYRFAPEDNLAYADFVRLHEGATHYISEHLPHAVVLSAWPGTGELSRPWLGYVQRPVRTVDIDDFSGAQILLAAQQPGSYDAAFVFSTKYDPGPGPSARLAFWRKRDEQ
ncbi:MAG: glycosyltransferase family 39 protein, partial [Acidobacteriales bacterium]|nr:glycosyltransferase family 39 protein [Terriglobales bacterium]